MRRQEPSCLGKSFCFVRSTRRFSGKGDLVSKETVCCVGGKVKPLSKLSTTKRQISHCKDSKADVFSLNHGFTLTREGLRLEASVFEFFTVANLPCGR